MASVIHHATVGATVEREVAHGVHIRAGILEVAGERTVSALVQRIYDMDFINDNAGCFANGGKFPHNGRTIEFGSHRVYFGTVPVHQCLSPVENLKMAVLAAPPAALRKDAKRCDNLCAGREDRRKIIGEEVTKLLVAGFIVEVTHTEWLANPVMVEKKKDENLEAKAPKVWRMCIDYTNLNKACPRDPFPLPRIDQVIDSTAGFLASPLEREPMLLYIAATNRVVSVVVVVEREEEGKTVQRPVYYLSEVLSSSKQNYPHFQKMTYGVFMAATKLKHYFEEHPMKVVSEAPISDIMGNKDPSGRIAKWAIQLSPYVPVYERRDVVKSQALADFLVDWAEMQYKPPEHKIEYLEDAF
ncbi:hypothetical protein QYE76_061231 [Lolium multiflorum]|uniref:Reverse transcriptase RNase H-like domain-containing protein n=1 Tax=Lolium multiflorum TaxID=4521 RepID=A0AAD8W4H6_LOLMU|nr:hypothetical protein QYE76_061231 [Lolium multiflorum]